MFFLIFLEKISISCKSDDSASEKMQLWHMTLLTHKLNEKCHYDWKRLARNMDFDDQDLKRMHEHHADVDEMIEKINHMNTRSPARYLEMLKELKRIKGGELYCSHVRPALKGINRTDVGKYLVIKNENSFK